MYTCNDYVTGDLFIEYRAIYSNSTDNLTNTQDYHLVFIGEETYK